MRQSLSAVVTEPDPQSAAIEVRDLGKRFGSVVALDGLDLRVGVGEVHGFLGPNGAGKTTTIRILLGQLRAGSGRAEVLGADPWVHAVQIHRRLAYVPGDTTLWPNLTGGECIDLLGALHSQERRAPDRVRLDRRRRDALIERFDLDPTCRTRSYSKGNRQKVALIAALAVDADLLLLDEPTSGLDPLMEAVFQECIREAVAAGCTVLLSSHLLDEVEALCDRVSIVRHGRVVSSGSLDELRRQTRTSVDATTAGSMPELDDWPGLSAVRRQRQSDGCRVTFRVAPEQLAAATAFVCRQNPVRLTVTPPSLDELFLAHYRDDLADRTGEGASR